MTKRKREDEKEEANVTMDWDNELLNACRQGDIQRTQRAIDQGATNNFGLYWACHGGHMALVNLLIKHGDTEFEKGLQGACHGRHPAVVELMIEKGAHNWDKGLHAACRSGCMALVKLMIEKGGHILELGIECRLLWWSHGSR